jgi:hypothetical protein
MIEMFSRIDWRGQFNIVRFYIPNDLIQGRGCRGGKKIGYHGQESPMLQHQLKRVKKSSLELAFTPYQLLKRRKRLNLDNDCHKRAMAYIRSIQHGVLDFQSSCKR